MPEGKSERTSTKVASQAEKLLARPNASKAVAASALTKAANKAKPKKHK